MKILIDYDCNILYSSQYIDYLRNNFKIFFKKTPFNSLAQKENLFLFSGVCDNGLLNFVIDFADSPLINEQAYKWSHVYGKINYNIISGNYSDIVKLVKLSPSFGVNIWNKYEALFYTIFHYVKFYPVSDFKKLLSNYLNQQSRLPLSKYIYNTSKNNYIFFASTLWNRQNHCIEESETNYYRANFIKACKSNTNVIFEGGFAPNKYREGYEDLFNEDIISLNEYIEKTKQSACVFNTPAVFSCHGWKLGEYLALGKAIISTPLKNELPVPLENGINVHIVSGEIDSIKNAIDKICSDDIYRKKLETGAYQYWLEYGQPQKSINKLFEKIDISLIKPVV